MANINPIQRPDSCQYKGAFSVIPFHPLVAVTLSSLLLSQYSTAEAWKVSPEFRLKSGYDNNLRLNEAEDGGVESTAVVGVELGRFSELSEHRGSIITKYVNYQKDRDEEDEEVLHARFMSDIKVNALNHVGYRVSYRRDYTGNVQRFDEVEVSDTDSDIDNDTDIGLIDRQVRRARTSFSPFWLKKFNENRALRLDYQYLTANYEDEPVDASLSDYDTHSIQATIDFLPTQTFGYHLSGAAERYLKDESESGGDVDSYSLTTGVHYSFTELKRLEFDIGYRNSSMDGEVDTDDGGVIARLAGHLEADKSKYVVEFERELDAGGSGDIVQSDAVNFRYRRNINPLTYIAMRARYIRNEKVFFDNASDRKHFLLEPSLNRKLSPKWTVGVSLRYSAKEKDGADDYVDSNAIFLSIKYRPLNEWSNRNRISPN